MVHIVLDDTFTPDQFEHSAMIRGYVGGVDLKAWMRSHPKDVYTEQDMLDLYHDCNRDKPRHIRPHGLSADGQDMESQGRRTYGKTNAPAYRHPPEYAFATIMRYEQGVNERIEAAWMANRQEDES